MTLQLQHILPGEAVGSLEEQGYALIQNEAMSIAKWQVFGVTDAWQLAQYRGGYGFTQRSRNAQYAYASATWRGGLRHDSVGVEHGCRVLAHRNGLIVIKKATRRSPYLSCSLGSYFSSRLCRPFFSN